MPQLCVTPFPHFWGLFPPQAKVIPNNDKKRTYSVTYVPKVGGLHKVSPLVIPPPWHAPPRLRVVPVPPMPLQGGMGDTWHSGVWGSLGGSPWSPLGMALGGPGVPYRVSGVPP